MVGRNISHGAAGAHELIAIVGMACRMPGTRADLDGFWDTLVNGQSTIHEVRRVGWESEGPGRWAALLERVDEFDAAFFRIAPKEALMVDPQQRILLEVAWEALEGAAIAPNALRGRPAGVYVASGAPDYQSLTRSAAFDVQRNVYSITGSGQAFAAGRLAYALGTEGPCLGVDTSCSSSLAAVHLACESLHNRTSDVAVVGAVNLILSSRTMQEIVSLRALSPSGRCRPFDAEADGFVRGEGCAVLVLKRLESAERDGDRVLAVIHGSAMNHDGRTRGFTVPNGDAQERLLRAALSNAGVDASDIGYVEAHGTGTPLGDPIEFGALRAIFGAERPDGARCVLGSVKGNIGHLEAAAGVASVVKVVLSIQRECIPLQASFVRPNPRIAMDGSPFVVPRENVRWSREATPRLAGVSSFGMSGTNVHIIIGEPPTPKHVSPRAARELEEPCCVPISARAPAALRELVARYADQLEADESTRISEVAWTAGTGRDHFEQRAAVVGRSGAEVARELREMLENDKGGAHAGRTGSRGKLAFAFAGHGSEHPGMGRELYEREAVFRHALDECDEICAHELGKGGLLDALWDEQGRVRQTRYAQSALTAFGYSMGRLWTSWGMKPDVVIGHSLGEYAAACVAGVLSIRDALPLVLLRGRLMQELPGHGKMLVVEAAEPDVRGVLAGREELVVIAAVNAADQLVLSGPANVVDDVRLELSSAGLKTRELQAGCAFHSPMMEPMLGTFADAAARVELRPPSIPLVSTMTGELVDSELTTAAYWTRQIREPVRFAVAVDTLQRIGVTTVLDVSPRSGLTALGTRLLSAPRALWLASTREGQSAREALLRCAAALYERGYDVDWRTALAEAARRVVLPTYPFQRRRFWAVPEGPTERAMPAARLSANGSSSELGVSRHVLDAERADFTADHRIAGRIVVSAAQMVSWMLAAANRSLGASRLENVSFDVALNVPSVGQRTIEVLARELEQDLELRICSAPDTASASPAASWTEHAVARAAKLVKARPTSADESHAFQAEGHELDVGAFYQRFAARGIEYGPAFRRIERLWRRGRTALAQLEPSRSAPANGDASELDVPAIDGSLQVIMAALDEVALGEPGGETLRKVFHVPVTIGAIECFGTEAPQWALAEVQEATPDFIRADVVVLDAQWRAIARFSDVRLKAIIADEARPSASRAKAFELAWEELDVSVSAARSADRILVLGEGGTVTSSLRQALRDQGGEVVELAPTASRGQGELEQLGALVGQAGLHTIVCLWPLAERLDPEASASAFAASLGRLQARILALLQELGRKKVPALRVWLVTEGAQSAREGDRSVDVLQASVWGTARVAAQEFPEHAFTCVDLDSAGGSESLLARDVLQTPDESELAYRGAKRYAPRLRRIERTVSDRGSNAGVELARQGDIESLRLQQRPRREPGRGEVEIEVRAAGLNFRDVLSAMGRYRHPLGPRPLGCECAGTVVRLGEDVNDLKVGDRVMALTEGAFASYVTVGAQRVVHCPASLPWAECGATPVAFITAHYGLVRLGDLRPGERVLIHAGAGGVGMAAIQIARLLGAEVIATARPDKWKYIQALGVKHVFSSRSLDFADGVRAVTNGEGVDVILNSLIGEYVERSIALLRAGGRFLEMGKPETVPECVRQGGPDAPSYRQFDISELGDAGTAETLAWIVKGMNDGVIRALPTALYGLDEATEAFRQMSQARHIGKIALRPRLEPSVRSDASYLVSGGLGALGLVSADWLIAQGAKHIILVGRSGPTAEAHGRITSWRGAGVNIEIVNVDLVNEALLGKALAALRESLPPVRGVLHAAGIVDDAPLSKQDSSRYAHAMAAKIVGAWSLYRCVQGDELDFWISFSSMVALLGSNGQSSYAAANAALDGLSHWLRRKHVHAVSVNWGPWAEAGMAVRAGRAAEARWSRQGMASMQAADGQDVLSWSLRQPRAQLGILPVDEGLFVASQTGRLPSLLRGWRVEPLAGERPAQAREPRLKDTLERAPEARRHGLALDFVEQAVRTVMALGADAELASDRALADAGLDSLMAIDLRNLLAKRSGLSLQATILFDYPTPNALADHLLGACELRGGAPVERPPANEERDSEDLAIDSLIAELSAEVERSRSTL